MPTIIRFIIFVVIMPLASAVITNIVMAPLQKRATDALIKRYEKQTTTI